MKLSIIIVNYNVKHFLKKLLQSINHSKVNFDFEIWVVDNNSVDGSIGMLKAEYPKVHLIENHKNIGFSKACNQAIKVAKGAYVLLLNPDTIVQEDTFQKVIQFMDEHQDAGALGVKMIDGTGNYLPESKRGLPTPAVSFYKMSGLSKLFAKSKRFGKYHLTFLDKHKTHKIDVLSGAFMLIRKSVLEEVGYLDEDYFMYGEDIDLSYRIQKAGYNNYYFPDTEIIHYKGESTKKGSLNYVRLFYKAMIIFTEKHFKRNTAITFFLKAGIYLRAFVAGVSRILKRMFWPITDALSIAGVFLWLKEFWQSYVKDVTFPDSFTQFNIPLYVGIWMISMFYTGTYDKPFKRKKLTTGILVGTLIISIIYAFLDLKLRSSRGMIVAGALLSFLFLNLLRFIVSAIKREGHPLFNGKTQYIVVGNKQEALNIQNLLAQNSLKKSYIGMVSDQVTQESLGSIHQLEEIVRVYQPSEVIFASENLENKAIIKAMSELSGKVNFKIAPQGVESLIGSHSKHTAGDSYTIDVGYKISTPSAKRNKNTLDFFLCLLFLVCSPVLLIVVKNRQGFLKNIFEVFFSRKSWVGYIPEDLSGLPKIKQGVLYPDITTKNETLKYNQNLIYAKDYSVWMDFIFTFNNLKNLGNQ